LKAVEEKKFKMVIDLDIEQYVGSASMRITRGIRAENAS
jgi:hypothetical protein